MLKAPSNRNGQALVDLPEECRNYHLELRCVRALQVQREPAPRSWVGGKEQG